MMKENSSRNKNKTKYAVGFVLIFLLVHTSSTAQIADTTKVNDSRIKTLVIGGSVGYAATMTGLYHIWYKNSESQAFRFFNDLHEWKQADKLGHFYSSFYFTYGTSRALQWAKVSPAKADYISAITGFAVLFPIEIFDGFSDAYGASGGDLIANAAGPAFFLSQKLLWNEIRILPKYSFHRTSFAAQRPELLGDFLVSEMIKDYNGQTHWLSFDMDKFTRFPKWLNIAVGYGAEEMIFARDFQNKSAGYDPYRQYYLSIDFDVNAIRTRSKFIKSMLFFVSMIKLPAPALEFSRKGTKFHGFYF